MTKMEIHLHHQNSCAPICIFRCPIVFVECPLEKEKAKCHWSVLVLVRSYLTDFYDFAENVGGNVIYVILLVTV